MLIIYQSQPSSWIPTETILTFFVYKWPQNRLSALSHFKTGPKPPNCFLRNTAGSDGRYRFELVRNRSRFCIHGQPRAVDSVSRVRNGSGLAPPPSLPFIPSAIKPLREFKIHRRFFRSLRSKSLGMALPVLCFREKSATPLSFFLFRKS